MPLFKDFKLNPELLQRLEELNFTTPTPIQVAAIPALLKGKDVAGQAETGTGKTAAFGLPILQNIDTNLQQIQALLVVPTRELALQVQTEMKSLARNVQNLKISAFYGGHSFSQERASLAFPPQILIGTPGRLTDHLNRRTIDLRLVKTFVLDEADKLLEMGFQEEIDQLKRALNKKRQNVLFSATIPENVKNLIADSLQDPEFIQVSETAIPDKVKTTAIKLNQFEKQDALLKLLQGVNSTGTIIFANTRAVADSVTAFLDGKKLSVKALHGGMEQLDRDKTMTLFRNGSVKNLVATDLAARGLDIAALNTIIHYELPDDEAAYMHRSGRTGRAGRSGEVYSFITPRDEKKIAGWEMFRIDHWLNVGDLEKSGKTNETTATAEFTTLHINAGRKDKISARDIVGALIAEAGLDAKQIGKIEVQDKMSYVAVPSAKSKIIADKLSNGKIKGRKFRVSIVA